MLKGLEVSVPTEGQMVFKISYYYPVPLKKGEVRMEGGRASDYLSLIALKDTYRVGHKWEWFHLPASASLTAALFSVLNTEDCSRFLSKKSSLIKRGKKKNVWNLTSIHFRWLVFAIGSKKSLFI